MDISYIVFYALLLIATLILTQFIYVKFTSPLRGIPGPLLGKMSGFYVSNIISKGIYHTFLKDMHEQYGSIVHFAPNRVIVNTKKGADLIYSTYKLPKAPFYRAFDYGAANVFSVGEKDVHSNRKKIIMKSISGQTLKDIEPLMINLGFNPFVEKLNQLSKEQGHCDIYKLIHLVLFTIMGQLVFSETFDLIENETIPVMKWLKEAQVYGIMQYEFPIVKLPGDRNGKKSYLDFIAFCKSFVIERKELINKAEKEGTEMPNNEDMLGSFLMAKNPKTGDDFSIEDITAEMITAMIAGTDTTANTLTWTIKLLTEHPDKMEKIVNELKEAFPDRDSNITSEKVKANCPYLEAALYEAMRLYPVGAGFLPRIVPKGGIELEGHHIPEGVEVGVGSYAYHRSEDVWDQPDEFQPERFLTKDSAQVKAKYLPFLIGPRSCLGREFAWVAMNLFMGNLLRKFEINNYSNIEITPTFFLILKPSQSEFAIGLTPRVS